MVKEFVTILIKFNMKVIFIMEKKQGKQSIQIGLAIYMKDNTKTDKELMENIHLKKAVSMKENLRTS